jgi:ribonuclease HI
MEFDLSEQPNNMTITQKITNIQNKLITVNMNNTYSKCINTRTLSWFTDGSCHGNGKKQSIGGYAAICVSGYKQNMIIYGRVDDRINKATNIRAEGTAIIKVLENLLDDFNNSGDKWDNSIIYSDSEFWIKMIYEYMPKWKPVAFEQKANPDMTKRIWGLWHMVSNKKGIEIKHVYAHNKDNSANSNDTYKRFCHDNNEIVDYMANIGRESGNYNTQFLN